MIIKNATEKLRDGAIDANEFLRRVIYQSPDLCNPLCAFDSVAPNADEVIDELVAPSSQETSREPSPQPLPEHRVQLAASQSEGAPSPRCRVCLDRLKTILLECNHFALCTECFDSLVAAAIAKPGPRSEKTKKKLRIKCPMCREMVRVNLCKPIFNC